jgi:hypothetical protein
VTTPAIIVRSLNQLTVGQRASDGYINATAMYQAAGKQWKHYHENQTTREFFVALAGSVGIPTDLLTSTIMTGPNEQRGSWVHPRVAIHLAMWCSAEFAVHVTGWVEQ